MRRQRITEELREQTAQARTLDEAFAKILKELGYGEGWFQQLIGHYTPRNRSDQLLLGESGGAVFWVTDRQGRTTRGVHFGQRTGNKDPRLYYSS